MVQLTKLRQATASYHQTIESNALLKSLMGNVTQENYLNVLRKFYGFYTPFEDQLIQGSYHYFGHQNFSYQPKTLQLQQDLTYFKIDHHSIPLCKIHPQLTSFASLLGCLYVLEGSTLGRMMLWKNISEHLNLDPKKGGNFFYGTGEKTRENWKQFCQLLTNEANEEQEEGACIQTAICTFCHLNEWFEQ